MDYGSGCKYVCVRCRIRGAARKQGDADIHMGFGLTPILYANLVPLDRAEENLRACKSDGMVVPLERSVRAALGLRHTPLRMGFHLYLHSGHIDLTYIKTASELAVAGA